MTRRVGVNRLLVGHRQVSTTPLATVTPPPPPTSNNNTQANSSKSSANSSNNTSSSSGGGGRRPARKAVLTLTPAAVERLKSLQTSNQYLKISVTKKGCSGNSYQLSYSTSPSKLDETVLQDGVTVIVDSKALFTLIGSTMDWREDELSNGFTFENPNVKEMCGCGQSFMT